jgi:hypothetical protein
MLLYSKNLNKIRQEPYNIDFFQKIRKFRVMSPGFINQIEKCHF